MTLDDETAARIAREVVNGGKATRVYPHSTDVALVRAGYAARDAEVEELRAERDEALAMIEQARDEATIAKVLEYVPSLPTNRAQADLRAILDESPTERETPADEPIAKRLTHMYMGDCPDEVNGWESRDPECPACRALGEVVPDDRA